MYSSIVLWYLFSCTLYTEWNPTRGNDVDSENSDDQTAEENAFSEEMKNIWAMEMVALQDVGEKSNKK